MTAASEQPQQQSTSPKMYAITITGIQLKNIFCYPPFYWYAIAAKNAAQNAPGNIHVSTNQCNMPNGNGQSRDTLMTLTVWEDRTSTLQYVYKSPAHIAAMKQVQNLSDYTKTYHYESTTIPTWEEAKTIWLTHGKEYDYDKKYRNENQDDDDGTKRISSASVDAMRVETEQSTMRLGPQVSK